ncbi:hypothetical protein [Endozoicomonas sp. ALB115]|uniref:hypothetical protein n=1 Tax=Endozoicomonas sp. ALB115 TaxID=3403074 RepID=UPI003BB5B348
MTDERLLLPVKPPFKNERPGHGLLSSLFKKWVSFFFSLFLFIELSHSSSIFDSRKSSKEAHASDQPLIALNDEKVLLIEQGA